MAQSYIKLQGAHLKSSLSLTDNPGKLQDTELIYESQYDISTLTISSPEHKKQGDSFHNRNGTDNGNSETMGDKK